MKIPAGWVAIYNRVDYAISDVQIGWKTLEGFVNMVEARAILGQRELEYHEYINERSNVDLVKAFDNLNKEY
jgi:type II secretory pathway component PulJ